MAAVAQQVVCNVPEDTFQWQWGAYTQAVVEAAWEEELQRPDLLKLHRKGKEVHDLDIAPAGLTMQEVIRFRELHSRIFVANPERELCPAGRRRNEGSRN